MSWAYISRGTPYIWAYRVTHHIWVSHLELHLHSTDIVLTIDNTKALQSVGYVTRSHLRVTTVDCLKQSGEDELILLPRLYHLERVGFMVSLLPSGWGRVSGGGGYMEVRKES
eukprot:sb/3476957/